MKTLVPLTFVVNGEDVPVELDLNAPLSEGRRMALDQSRNTGRPAEDWEIRDEAGRLLEPAMTPSSLDLLPRALLFLSLRIGAGGVGRAG
ncbi:MAG: DUF2604 domain-containing protein [Polyangiales bacterium]